MLQYTAHPSPFAFSDGPKKSSSSASTPRFLSNAPSKLGPHRLAVPLTQKRSIDTDLSQDRFSFSPSLSVSTSYSSLPSPNFPPSALPQVVPRPPYASSHSNDFPPPPSSKEHSSISSHAEDILSHGDIVGEGIPLLGEPLRLVANRYAEHVPAADHQEPATEFEVVRKLGTGSYAVVYHVREVLSRSPPSEDDHIYPGGRLELDDVSISRSPLTEYGREYAIKLLSKADLDEEELVAQLTEVRSVTYLSLVRVLKEKKTYVATFRQRFINPFPRTPTLSPCIARWKLRRFSFSFSNLFPVKISSTFWSRPAIITMSILPPIHL
jgi:hypothetical protein